ETAAGAFMDMREPAGIVLLVNENIGGLRHAQAVTPNLHRAMVVVKLDVKEALAIRAPYHRAVCLLDQILKVGAIGPVAHADREVFRALDIGTPGLKPVIRRMPRAAELEVLLGGRQLIAVEHDLDVAAVARHAAEHFVLTALAEF